MAFKPTSNVSNDDNGSKLDWNAINKQVKGGSRPARISLIVSLGIQERDVFQEEYVESNAKHIKALSEDGYLTEEDDKTFINIPQKPQEQVAVFVDLVNDIVDYGDEIGKAPYRLLLNKSFKGDVAGIGFAGTYSFDNKGKILKEKGFTFHSNSVLTKLAKATGQEQIIAGSGPDNMDISQLLGKAIMVQVDKTVTEEGSVYLNYKSCSSVPMIPSDPSDPDSEEVLMTIKETPNPVLAIGFDDITLENKKWLRGDIIKKIKKATNYEGNVKTVLEAKNSESSDSDQGEEAEEVAESKPTKPTKPASKTTKPTEKPVEKKPAGKAKEAPVQTPADSGDEESDDMPF